MAGELAAREYIVSGVFIIGALAMDLKNNKIRNEYILVGFLVAFLVELADKNIQGNFTIFMFICCEILFIFVLLYPTYLIGALGAGDIKLFMVLSVMLPIRIMLPLIYESLCVGAVEGIFFIAKDWAKWQGKKEYKKERYEKNMCEKTGREKNGHRICFTVCIFIAFMLEVIKEQIL